MYIYLPDFFSQLLFLFFISAFFLYLLLLIDFLLDSISRHESTTHMFKNSRFPLFWPIFEKCAIARNLKSRNGCLKSGNGYLKSKTDI